MRALAVVVVTLVGCRAPRSAESSAPVDASVGSTDAAVAIAVQPSSSAGAPSPPPSPPCLVRDPSGDARCAPGSRYHHWSAEACPNGASPETLRRLADQGCTATGPHLAFNIEGWCCGADTGVVLPPKEDRCVSDAECGVTSLDLEGPTVCCFRCCSMHGGRKSWTDAVEAACKAAPGLHCPVVACACPSPPYKPKCVAGRCTLTY
jgi:hypothetical protein